MQSGSNTRLGLIGKTGRDWAERLLESEGNWIFKEVGP